VFWVDGVTVGAELSWQRAAPTFAALAPGRARGGARPAAHATRDAGVSIHRFKDHWREQHMFLGRLVAAAVIIVLLAGW
jgi:hypothetical protein